MASLSAGEIMFTLVLIATQGNLLRKIEHLSNILKKKIGNTDNKIRNGINNLFSSKEESKDKEENNETTENEKQNNQNNITNENINTMPANTYSDRVLPINTREENKKINFNTNNQNLSNQNNLLNFNTNTNNQNLSNQNNLLNLNTNTNQNFSEQNSFYNQNSTNNIPTTINNQNDFMNSFGNQNIPDSTNITKLQINNSLYSQDFKPTENGGNFSFLNNNDNVNISKTLDYSSLLSDVYN